jgi:DNA-directed RNA polymerase specialized sigma24 family protein
VACRAALTACLREGCRSAEDAFAPIVSRAAFGAMRGLGDVKTPRGQDLLSEAVTKGWSLLLRGEKCAPRTVLSGQQQESLGAYLYRCMRNKVIDELRKERDSDLPLDDLGEEPAAAAIQVDDSVVSADQAALIQSALAAYRREQVEHKSAKRAALFEVWLAERLRPTRSQEDVAAYVSAALGHEVHQTTVSRQFGRFREELLARIEALPGIDDHTRQLARQLFEEGHYPRPERTARGDGGTNDE